MLWLARIKLVIAQMEKVTQCFPQCSSNKKLPVLLNPKLRRSSMPGVSSESPRQTSLHQSKRSTPPNKEQSKHMGKAPQKASSIIWAARLCFANVEIKVYPAFIDPGTYNTILQLVACCTCALSSWLIASLCWIGSPRYLGRLRLMKNK